MNEVEKKIYKMRPEYLVVFEELVNRFAQFGGGSADEKYIYNKSFSNAYEIYMYSFFIGLYNDQKYEATDADQLKSFWEVENWKPRPLVDYLLACALAESDFDMASVERLEEEGVREEVLKLKNTIESYANGGLKFINSILSNDPEQMHNELFFIELLGKSCGQSEFICE